MSDPLWLVALSWVVAIVLMSSPLWLFSLAWWYFYDVFWLTQLLALAWLHATLPRLVALFACSVAYGFYAVYRDAQRAPRKEPSPRTVSCQIAATTTTMSPTTGHWHCVAYDDATVPLWRDSDKVPQNNDIDKGVLALMKNGRASSADYKLRCNRVRHCDIYYCRNETTVYYVTEKTYIFRVRGRQPELAVVTRQVTTRRDPLTRAPRVDEVEGHPLLLSDLDTVERHPGWHDPSVPHTLHEDRYDLQDGRVAFTRSYAFTVHHRSMMHAQLASYARTIGWDPQ